MADAPRKGRDSPGGKAARRRARAAKATSNPLREYFESHDAGRGIYKWLHYFDIYHRHFARFRGTAAHVLEIGVGSGGSLEMWRHYFGPASRVFGVDILEECKAFESDGIEVRSGDQSDRAFWNEFKRAVPRLDVVIDDGSHEPEHQRLSFDELFPHLEPGGVYLCEDVQGVNNPFLRFLKRQASQLSFVGEPLEHKARATNDVQRTIRSISLYPFVAVVEKNPEPVLELGPRKRGTDWITPPRPGGDASAAGPPPPMAQSADGADQPKPRKPSKRRQGAPERRAAGADGAREVRSYLKLLRLLHRHLRPRTYVEIGVASGRSLARARPETLCIGIDPAPSLRQSIPASTRIFELASDEFFTRHDLRQILDGRPVDLAFIDGMHLFEFALRDFIQLERAAGTGSVITIHDCDPPNEEVATREQRTAFWTGDIWKLVLGLRQYRPDLRVAVVDVPPSGLGIVTNLDPASAVLEERYTEICEGLLDLPYGQLAESKREKLNIVPPSWEHVRTMLPAPSERDQEDALVSARPGPRGAVRPPPRFMAREAEPKGKPVAERLATKHALRVGASASGDITLRGYPEPVLERVLEAAKQLDVRSDVPAIQRFRNLTFVPKFAALYDEGGQRVLETCVRRGPGLREIQHRPPEALEVPRRAPRIDRPVIYCGRLRAHWGHFLTETISRVWAPTDPGLPPDAALLFQDYPRRATGFVHSFFRHVGIDRSRFLDLDSVTTLSEVFVPHPSFSLGGQSFRRHAALPERVAEAICTDTRPETEQPVYLSRRLAPSRQRRPGRGERELEEALRRRGTRIVAPETLPYEDQVRLFNHHSIFIGRIGSAFHSLLYALPGRALRTVVIGGTVSYYDPGYYPDYFMIDALKGIRSTYLFDPTDAGERAGGTALNADATVGALERLSVI